MPSFCPLSRNLLTLLPLRWDDLRKLYVLIETSPNPLCPVVLISRASSWVTAPGRVKDAGQNRPIHWTQPSVLTVER